MIINRLLIININYIFYYFIMYDNVCLAFFFKFFLLSYVQPFFFFPFFILL